jgi:hypothetical protein
VVGGFTLGQSHVWSGSKMRKTRIEHMLSGFAPIADISEHVLRKRLQRSGLGKVPVIGGFEIAYKAAQRVWILHANLVMIGGEEKARKKFKKAFRGDDFDRPLLGTTLKDRAEQLSYVLKFTTYHRPYEQRGATRSEAKPLNPKEHAALLKWMWQFEFKDFLLLINARRQGGNKIVLSPPGAAKN